MFLNMHRLQLAVLYERILVCNQTLSQICWKHSRGRHTQPIVHCKSYCYVAVDSFHLYMYLGLVSVQTVMEDTAWTAGDVLMTSSAPCPHHFPLQSCICTAILYHLIINLTIFLAFFTPPTKWDKDRHNTV